ncbi:MAG: 16S rRNA (cytosine(967)-C(5))-methyltransferase RsmB [Clostridia bacterium]|nr:16S rRNA (cytosine(967)-C(5))-methyltransferase RsmB [Clostridia bacterium]
MDNPRRLALDSLVKWEGQDCFSNIEVNTTLSRASMEKNDSALYTFLFLGVIEKKLLLDRAISQYSQIKLEEIDIITKNILRLGIYQLLFADRIPDYSAVNECVSLASKRTKGFVNAVLRAFIRAGKDIDLPAEKWARLSLEQSIPMELVRLLRDSYGDDTAERICTHKRDEYLLSLRVNTLVTTAEAVMDELASRELSPTISRLADDIVKCKASIDAIKDLIDTGKAFVQDESSRICSMAVCAEAGDRVLDACACPGGKTFSMAIDMENKGEILACDLHKNKLSLISKGSAKLGINIITVREQNGKSYVSELNQQFDKVLCDVPCSGLGVMFKKPEIKYKSLESINGLPSVQYGILSNCSKYVRTGGVLVYSTCTTNAEENERNVLKFLSENEGFEPLDFNIGSINSRNGMYTFFSHTDGTDGFFVAKLKRVK